jgi:hypothetical protein
MLIIEPAIDRWGGGKEIDGVVGRCMGREVRNTASDQLT